MSTFATPEPVSVSIEMLAGTVNITAEDRTDTVVTVEPANPDSESDKQMAAQARVDYANGTLTIKARNLRDYVSWTNKSRSVIITINLPTGSHLTGTASIGNLNATGRLGNCEFKAGVGDMQVEQAATAKLRTVGDVTVGHIAGDAELSTGSGELRLHQAGGTATVKNANGNSWIGEVTGAVQIRASNGRITVDEAHADVNAVAANGDIRIGSIHSGVVELKTSMGELEVGVPEGISTWIDAQTAFGKVRNQLDSTDRPKTGQSTAKVSARTSYGDITIRRPLSTLLKGITT